MRAPTLGIDLGGTKMAAAVVSPTGELLERVTWPRPATAAAMRDEPIALARRMLGGGVGAIGIGVAGLVRDGVMVWGPNVAGHDIPFAEALREACGVPTFVDNDANLALLAESRQGAAAGYRHVLMMTLGTGIGGGWLIDGNLYRGRGFAGEIGHMTVDVGGRRCTCGGWGCWEAYCSGRRLDELAARLTAAEPDGPVAGLAGAGRPAARHLVEAAARGDEGARAGLEEVAEWMGIGIANLVAAFDPEIVVVGGAVAAAGEALLEPARRSMVAALEGAEYRHQTPIVAARLGEDAGVIGAAIFARESLG